MEMRVVAVEERAASIKREACKAKVWMSEVEQEFQREKNYTTIVMDDARSLAKKLKKAGNWLALMCKWMTNAHQQEAQVTEDAQMKITNLKESFYAKVTDLKSASHAQVHWLWDELRFARDKNMWL